MKKMEKLDLMEIKFLPFFHLKLSIDIYEIHNSLSTMGLRKKSIKGII